MPEKTFKVLLLSINGIILIAVIGAVFALFSFLKSSPDIDVATESVSARLESDENNQNNSTPNEELSQESIPEDEAVMAQADELFIVKAYNGKIAVFLEGEDEPYMELDISLSDLTQADAILLERGITARTPAELLNILEDYDY